MLPTLLICPGIHHAYYTEQFLKELAKLSLPQSNLLVLPTQVYPSFSAWHILEFLNQEITHSTPLIFIGFSAGVAGAIGAAWGWQLQGGKVRAFFAFDGWGVPLGGDFAIHRLSHDQFTHWSSGLLGTQNNDFYADPGVSHLQLWETPQLVTGWQIKKEDKQTILHQRISLLDFFSQLLSFYLTL